MAVRYLVLLVLVGCDVGELDPIGLSLDAQGRGQNPCDDPGIRKKANVKRGADGRFVGTNERDIIFGTTGSDVIIGNGGDDLICALGGPDFVFGGEGRDHIFGGAGQDTIHGQGGSDRIWGGDGNDVLFGDILDDKLYGQADDDTLIGGHGTDTLDGGPGADFLRGDTGNDIFLGGDGYDVASFATALPPGQPEVTNDGTLNPITGVAIDGGRADGDGGNEGLGDVESIVGSPFTDRIEAGGRNVQPTFGGDLVQNANGPPPGGATPTGVAYIAVATLGNELVDVGVHVLGTTGDDNYQIRGNGNVVVIEAAAPLAAGTGCANQGANLVRCDVGAFIATRPHRRDPLHYIAGWGDTGADTFAISGDFPRELEVHISGGKGSDRLIGGNEADVFFSGVTGNDHLEGRGGDDALLGESQHPLGWADGARPDTAFYDDGADTLDGGPGNDQLVVDYVCGGHRFLGGDGHDIAGFARSGKPAIHAQLGGPARLQTQWYGFAANLDKCGSRRDRWTSWKTGVEADLEVLESSEGNDKLWGDDRNNVLWGRDGNDEMYGLGGNDELLGALGTNQMDGGDGDDDVRDGQGVDE
ncbi:MAG TPA: calcium-binding protein [Kofleriaceae bacterium]